MKTTKGIPDSDYNRLVELLGKQKAEEYIDYQLGNYKAVVFKIYREELKLFAKNASIEFWLLGLVLIVSLTLWIVLFN